MLHFIYLFFTFIIIIIDITMHNLIIYLGGKKLYRVVLMLCVNKKYWKKLENKNK